MSNQKKEQHLSVDIDDKRNTFDGGLKGSDAIGRYIYGTVETNEAQKYILRFELKTITEPGSYRFGPSAVIGLCYQMANGEYEKGGRLIEGELTVKDYNFEEAKIEGTFSGRAQLDGEPELALKLANGIYKFDGITHTETEDFPKKTS
jgi:hypothetical protein